MLKPLQHKNVITLPIGTNHTLSIYQFSGDLYCGVALFDNKTDKPIKLTVKQQWGEGAVYGTEYHEYVTTAELSEIIASATAYVER